MLKRVLAVMTAAAVTLSCMICGSFSASAAAENVYSEDFSNEKFTAGEKIAGVKDGAAITPLNVNNGTWKWTSTNTNPAATTNKAVFTAVSDNGNMAAKYEHTLKNSSNSTNNERYGVVFDNALEGDVSISFKLKKSSSNTPNVYIFVGDDGTTDKTNYPLNKNNGGNTTWGASLFKLIQNTSNNVLGAYYPASIFRDNVPGSASGDASITNTLSDSEWSEYSISINTYTGKTSFTCGETTKAFDACTGGIGAKVGSFYFYIERNGAESAFLIDDITVKQNNIEKLTFAEVTGESDNTVSANTLPATFNGLGASWTVKWSGENVSEDGTVTHGKTAVTTDLKASFYNGTELIGEKTFSGITITAFDALASIDFDAIKGSNTEQGAITSDLTLPASVENGSDSYPITWSSSNPDAVSASGKVVRTAFDAPVLLTAECDGKTKGILVNVAAERTDMYFEEYMTSAAMPDKFSTWNKDAADTWTVRASSSTSLEVPSVAADPTDKVNKVLEIKKIGTRDANAGVLANAQSGLYHKAAAYTSNADVQYVSLDIFPTETTPRTEIRVIDTDGIRIAGICYAKQSLSAFSGSNSTAFEDVQTANNSLTVNKWANITLKLDYTAGYFETYLNGNYVGKYILNSTNKNVGYVFLGMERNEKNPATGSAFTAENPGYVYFDNITIRTAASEENGVYEVVSYENGVLKLRKIVNTDKNTMVIAAAYSGEMLAGAKVKQLGSGKTLPSIITINDFDVSGDSIKVFNWTTETLNPVGNGVILSK